MKDLTKITTNTLSEITHYPTVSIGPNKHNQIIEDIKFVLLGTQTMMAIILTDSGIIKETIIKFDEDITENQVQTLNDMREGYSTKMLAKMVDNDFRLNNYDLIHALGHGVGLDIHESPIISTRSENILKENMVVTDEPGIYIAGQFGIRIEDTVLITKGGCEALTKSNKEYVVI